MCIRDSPNLVIGFEERKITYQFEDCIDSLCFPVKLNVNGKATWIKPTVAQQSIETEVDVKELTVDRNFYLRSSVNGEPSNESNSEDADDDVK